MNPPLFTSDRRTCRARSAEAGASGVWVKIGVKDNREKGSSEWVGSLRGSSGHPQAEEGTYYKKHLLQEKSNESQGKRCIPPQGSNEHSSGEMRK